MKYSSLTLPLALSTLLVHEAEAGMSSAVAVLGYHTNTAGGAVKHKIAHTYKCKNPSWLRWALGKWNHYDKFELSDDCANVLGCDEGSNECAWSGEEMIFADDVCDYTPKHTYAYIKAQQNKELRLDFIDFGLWSSASNDDNGFRLRLYMANLRISKSTDRSSGGSDYDEIYIDVDHENNKYSVKLKRDSDTVKTWEFDANGMCLNTSCDENNFSETRAIPYAGGKINPSRDSNDELAYVDFEWKGKDCSYPSYYCAQGESNTGLIVNCWN